MIPKRGLQALSSGVIAAFCAVSMQSACAEDPHDPKNDVSGDPVSVQTERQQLLKENQQLQVDAIRAEVARLRKANEALRHALQTQQSTSADSLPLTDEQAKLRAENEKLRAKLVQAECDRLRKENEALQKRASGAEAAVETAKDCQFVPASFSIEDFERLKEENRRLREQQHLGPLPIASADAAIRAALDSEYGRNPSVSSKHGKLNIGGLLQVWYYTIQRDEKSWVNAQKAAGTFSHYGANDINSAGSFRVRTAELRFALDLTDTISAHIMLDPAAEAGSFPSFPSNQGTGVSGESDVFTNAGFALEGDAVHNALTPVPIDNVRNDFVRNGSGYTNKLLQDAYINYHGFIPYHDLSVGQFKRHIGEEGTRDSKELDFVERAMITQMASVRDLGIQAHGSWFDGKYQYWIGGFNGAGTAFQSRYNRADDNNDKDLVVTGLVRPVRDHDIWGDLELGASLLFGWAGGRGSTGRFDGDIANDGLNRQRALHRYRYAWVVYKPRAMMAGTWFRGEFGDVLDRFAPGEVASFTDQASTWPCSFTTRGWYASSGYKLSESILADSLKGGGTLYRRVLLPMEFAFRFENMGNLFFQSLNEPGRKLRFYHTRVLTSGINYYVCGQNAKIQLNYNIVDEENDDVSIPFDRRQVREVRNNNLILNFQVSW